MTLHLRCKNCDFLDVVKFENAKSWKCPGCVMMESDESESIQLQLSFDPNIKIKPPKYLHIDTDDCNAQIITIKRHGKEITFPMWQFWKVLEEQDKKDKGDGK